ncbi:hypothetical protein QMZ05_13925 [Bradyrhizobium sp. INPA03-11B]|uniref:hypothetical protein n=1 Tax=Bradyrhizobium sp. INPA03-11B TaxID=418598 RepID=UPI00338FA157
MRARRVHADRLDFEGIDKEDAISVRAAIDRGEVFAGYIPETALDFIVRNFQTLAKLGVLEESWLAAYVHSSNLAAHGLSIVNAVFDACDRNRLLELKPLGEQVNRSRGDRLTLFRGCAGPIHTMGMSWTPSLDKAIWYAAHHAEYHGLTNRAVYVATVQIAEIYCRLDHYDDDFIVRPLTVWRVDVPDNEFRLDRPR